MIIEKQEQMDKITNAVCDAIIIIGNFFYINGIEYMTCKKKKSNVHIADIYDKI